MSKHLLFPYFVSIRNQDGRHHSTNLKWDILWEIFQIIIISETTEPFERK